MTEKNFSFKTRTSEINKLKQELFDILIIGGGINGAGIARDASSRGLKVALVEARDFAIGTSSRSSKLIHGGIRYLENFEFGLVHEALTERSILFEIAPHLVHPLRFIIPLFKESRVGMFKMGLGMWAYDFLALLDTPEMHQRLETNYFSTKYPFIKMENLLGGYSYFDGYMDDDRLVIETLRSAVNMGAVAQSYIKINSKINKKDGCYSIEAKDEINNESFSINFKHIISSVGPWTDHMGKLLEPNWKNILRPTKGVHLTFDRTRIPLSDAVVMGAEQRIVFAIPRHEMVIIGTTDTDFSGDPSNVKVEVEDVNYLLKVTNEYFPGLNIKKEDILASYAGVRPLVRDSSESEGKTSREHKIWSVQNYLTFVAGGKYTTYRLIAKQCVDHILEISQSLFNNSRSKTDNYLNSKVTIDKISRLKIESLRLSKELNIPKALVDMSIERHGEECLEFLFKELPIKIEDPEERYWALEAAHAINTTNCFNLVDFYWRRSPLFLSRKDHGLNFLESIKSIFRFELGYSDTVLNTQKLELERQIKLELDWE